MTVFLDIILIYNFLIDGLLLWSTAYILKLRPKWYRLAAGAALGASYTIVIFFPTLSMIFTFLSKLLLSILMVLCVFGFHRIAVFFRRLLIFYLVAFILGGGLLGTHYFLQSESEILSGIMVTHSGGVGTPITWSFIAIGFPVLWVLSGKGLKQIKEGNRRAALYMQVEVEMKGQIVSCTGLLDTGNQLFEPITRIPVTIIDVTLFREHLPQTLYEYVLKHEDWTTTTPFMDLDDYWLQRVRMIPYRSVSRGMDLLLAIRPDQVKILSDGKWYQTTRALIGLNPVSLSSDGSYQAIVHPGLVAEEHLVLPDQKEISKEAI